MTADQIAAARALAAMLRQGFIPDDRLGAAATAINTLADEVERLQPEPLTREQTRAWLDRDIDRIEDDDEATYRDGDTHRAALYTAIDEHDSDYGDGRLWDALADLLVDAAAGRVR